MSLMQFWINFHLYHVDNKWRFDETMMVVSMISMARPTEFFDRKAMYHEYNDIYGQTNGVLWQKGNVSRV
jgi:hypothetical protein